MNACSVVRQEQEKVYDIFLASRSCCSLKIHNWEWQRRNCLHSIIWRKHCDTLPHMKGPYSSVLWFAINSFIDKCFRCTIITLGNAFKTGMQCSYYTVETSSMLYMTCLSVYIVPKQNQLILTDMFYAVCVQGFIQGRGKLPPKNRYGSN